MIVRLFHLIQSWTAVSLLAFSLASCIKGSREDFFFLLRDQFINPMEELSAYITGQYEDTPCKQDFSQAHMLFQQLEKRLREYPIVVQYPIPYNTLIDIDQRLSLLKEDIESLPDSQDKSQFKAEWNKLKSHVALLIAKQDGP